VGTGSGSRLTINAICEGDTLGNIAALQSTPTIPGANLISYQFTATGYNSWGLRHDEFVQTSNWPHQLYSRKAGAWSRIT